MPSLFGEILSELVGQIPGAQGAVFLDWEGEAVDQFSHIPLMDILLAGAHWGIVLRLVNESLDKLTWGEAEVVVLNGTKSDVIIKAITDEYSLVVALKSGTHLASALTEIDRFAELIFAEM